ncbi:hypothetical protein BDAP_001879 [Binucleata daphniae]
MENVKSQKVKDYTSSLLNKYKEMFTVNKYFDVARFSTSYVFKTLARDGSNVYDLKNIKDGFLNVMQAQTIEKITEENKFTAEEAAEFKTIIDDYTTKIRNFFILQSKLFITFAQMFNKTVKTQTKAIWQFLTISI